MKKQIMFDNILSYFTPNLEDYTLVIKLIKITIRENISSRNQQKNHYRKLDYAKIYLLKVCSSKKFFMVSPLVLQVGRFVGKKSVLLLIYISYN